MFRVTSIVSMYASILLRGPLIFISFIVFFSLSYGAVYASNSVAFNIIGHGGKDSFFILQAFEYLVMFSLLGVLYYASFKTLTDVMVSLPDYVMEHIGVRGIKVNVAGTFALAVSAKAMSSTLNGAADTLTNGMINQPLQKKREEKVFVAGKEQKGKEMREALKSKGLDYDVLVGNAKPNSRPKD